MYFHSIPIFPSHSHGEGDGHDCRHQLGNNEGDPDAVRAPDEREKHDRGDLKDEGTQKRDRRRDRAVVEGGEKSRSEDGDAAEQKGEGIEEKSAQGKAVECGIVAHEHHGQGAREQFSEQEHGDRGDDDEAVAFLPQALQFTVILRAVVVADHGSGADGVADEDRHKDHAHVHQNAVRGNAVLALIADELDVVEHSHQRHGDVAHQLGRAVGAGAQKRATVKGKRAEAKQACVFSREVEKRNDPTHHLAQRGRERRAHKTERKNGDEQGIEDDVGNARRDRGDQPKLGFFRGDKEALELHLEHERGDGDENDPTVGDAVVEHRALCPEK